MENNILKNITIFGAGAFGTALAIACHRRGLGCTLWGRDDSQIQAFNKAGENLRYLPGIPTPSDLFLTSNLEKAADKKSLWLIATKAEGVIPLLKKLRNYATPQTHIILGAKGLSQLPNRPLLHWAAQEIIPEASFYAISGPSFAHELATGLPTAMVLAGKCLQKSQQLASALTDSHLRIYPSDDPTGVLFGGAFKNVLAIGAGIVQGANLGENARAALLCRGFHEMCLLGQKMGAQTTTLFGLAGLGDLSLTAMSQGSSRNSQFGFFLGQGHSSQGALDRVNKTVEGFNTALSAVALATSYALELPIMEGIAALIQEQKTLEEVMTILLNRPLPNREWSR